jgi:uncharacterized protein
MSGETDLARLLSTMQPEVREGEFVVLSFPSAPAVECEAVVREMEGVTCIVRREIADERGWEYDFVAGWVTLQVHSALESVGLTAAVSATLAERGIPSNVLAGFFHDHLLVPADRVRDTVRALTQLSERGAPARD